MFPSKKLLAMMKNIGYATRHIKNLYPAIERAKNNLFTKYLLVTNLTISTSSSGLGDFVEQMFEIISKNQANWDKIRTLKLSATGLTLGVICHYWYIYLDRRFVGPGFVNVLKKMIYTQFINSPICILTFFMTFGILSQWSKEQALEHTIEKGKKMYLNEWFIWPTALIIGFYYLPTKYRVLYDSGISFGFDVYYSYLVNKELPNKKIE